MSDILTVDGLRAAFGSREVVHGIGFRVGHGRAVGLVGETGSGKSVTVRSVLGLIRPPGRVTAGSAMFDGTDLLKLPPRQMRRIRGDRIGFIAQNPFGALNPILSIRKQFHIAMRAHRKISKEESYEAALIGLRSVGVAGPERVLAGHAHELSGGMAQRVVIALVMSMDPTLIVADEPTTALDLTVQRQVLDLIDGLIRDTGRSMLLITHDLGVVAQYCQDVVVMNAGTVVESGTVADVFGAPEHPYTQQLLAASAETPAAKPSEDPHVVA
ncbi:ABC transporter ATP-binding protein [Dactylosporangium salmoneum]|uniref:ATP-binding cassette domain-containing protein n=1 Tax=Dactylosporangium salmoneum TaxID=53361 RepID=A0ABP5TDA4_9ACTN